SAHQGRTGPCQPSPCRHRARSRVPAPDLTALASESRVSTVTADLPAVGDLTAPVEPPSSRRGWGLRRRIMLTFTLGALLLSVVLAFVTYGFARTSVVQQRDRAAREAALSHATLVADALRAGPPTVQPAQEQLERIGIERTVYWYNGQWSGTLPFLNESQLQKVLIILVT